MQRFNLMRRKCKRMSRGKEEGTDLVPYLPVTPTSVLVLVLGGKRCVGEGRNCLLFVRFVMFASWVGRLDCEG